MPRRHVLSKCVNQVLACGCSNERGMCWLPFRPLSGAARASVLVFLAREGLVRVTDWSTEGKSCRAGSVIGLVTNKGRKVRARGYL